jgi:predicted peptidase
MHHGQASASNRWSANRTTRSGVKTLPLLFLVLVPFACATPSSRQTHEIYRTGNEQMRYLLFLPAEYGREPAKKWPLILFFHGSGECGDDWDSVKKHGPPKIVEKNRDFPFIVVSPQLPSVNATYSDEFLSAWLNNVFSSYQIDMNRIYLTGLSLGGYITWLVAEKSPHLFAAIAPVCGVGTPELACRLKNVPVWAFHGAKDNLVPVGASIAMVEAIKKCGGDARLTVYPEAGHDSWTETYDNPELYEWFLRQKRH